MRELSDGEREFLAEKKIDEEQEPNWEGVVDECTSCGDIIPQGNRVPPRIIPPSYNSPDGLPDVICPLCLYEAEARRKQRRILNMVSNAMAILEKIEDEMERRNE